MTELRKSIVAAFVVLLCFILAGCTGRVKDSDVRSVTVTVLNSAEATDVAAEKEETRHGDDYKLTAGRVYFLAIKYRTAAYAQKGSVGDYKSLPENAVLFYDDTVMTVSEAVGTTKDGKYLLYCLVGLKEAPCRSIFVQSDLNGKVFNGWISVDFVAA